MDNVWGTVDRLIHDLGAIRAFLDEAAAVPEVSEAPQIADVRGAMDEATDAISRVLVDSQQRVIESAWVAIAHAQDTVVKARAVIASARTKQHEAEPPGERNPVPYSRAFELARSLTEHTDRLRRHQPMAHRPLATSKSEPTDS